MFFKERPIFSPCFTGGFVECPFDREEKFRRFTDGMVGPIDGEEHDEQDDCAETEPHGQRGLPNRADEGTKFLPPSVSKSFDR